MGFADVTAANPLGVPSSLDKFSTSAQEASTPVATRSGGGCPDSLSDGYADGEEDCTLQLA